MANLLIIFIIFLEIVCLHYLININDTKVENFHANFPKKKDIYNKKIKRIKKSVIKKKRFMWDIPVKYHVKRTLGDNVVDVAIKLIQEETCINFTKSQTRLTTESGITFRRHRDICSSYEGKQFPSGPQSILLSDECKVRVGAILHEIGHALGLHHEISRRDRNNYVKIIRKNVEKNVRSNFAFDPLHNSQTFGISYDLGSIMHYDLFAFSDNDEATVIPLDENYNETIGQQVGYTFNDVKLLNFLYCNHTCPDTTSLKCHNYGYLNPNNCSRCKCPHGFAGVDCTILQPQSNIDLCGDHYFNATQTESILEKTGIMNCTFLIKSQSGKKVNIKITKMIANPAPNPDEYLHCFTGMALEVKHKIDTSVTGLCLCGDIDQPIYITSEGDQVIILWYGKANNHTFTLEYKEVDTKKT